MTIRSKPSDDNYREQFDRIFGPPKRPLPKRQVAMCVYPGCVREYHEHGAHIIGGDDAHPQAD